MNASGCEKPDNYFVELRTPAELRELELAACLKIVQAGEAVGSKSVQRELPVATILAIVRCGEQIVGVGAIKRQRLVYTAGIARKSGAVFPPETLELGYVAIDALHQGQGLSHRLVQALLSGRTDRLFATTSSSAIKKVLRRAGFVHAGNEWKGTHSQLSCWLTK